MKLIPVLTLYMQDIYKGGLAAEPVLYCIYNMPDFHKKVKFSAIFYMSPFVVFICMDKSGSIQLCRSVNYPHLKKQASEEDSLNTQASNPQVLSFPTYPGDILCHVYERDPVAR